MMAIDTLSHMLNLRGVQLTMTLETIDKHTWPLFVILVAELANKVKQCQLAFNCKQSPKCRNFQEAGPPQVEYQNPEDKRC